MNLKKKTDAELQAMLKEYRPEAVSQIFFIFALISSAAIGESFNIIHEYVKEFHRNFYSHWAWVFVVLSIAFAAGVIFLAFYISVDPHDKVFTEIERRSKLKKKSVKRKSKKIKN